tara:strand:- start:1296 stop:2342 length:1047 start_codon:yes stop_codon:yes gene_type:complete
MILVTGGTGLVGSHLLWELLQRNENQVRAIFRTEKSKTAVLDLFRWKVELNKSSTAAEDFYNRIEWIKADVNNIPQLTLAFKNVTYVYHSAALISFNPKRFAELQKINIEGTANMVNLSISNQVKKFCMVSSVAALGSTENGLPVTEETHWDVNKDNSVYSVVKYASEMEVWRATQEGLEAIIVNPGIILGEGFYSSGSGRFFKQIDKGLKYTVPGSTGFVDVLDVVRSMIELMKSPTKNERFILVGANEKFKDVFFEIADKLNASKPTKMVKPWQLSLAWRLDWLISKLTGKRRSIYKSTANFSLSDVSYDANKLKTNLDFNFTSINETINRVGMHSNKSKANRLNR